MPTDAQVRGMLLEEAILYLLRASGYHPIETRTGDLTLEKIGGASLGVKGRGGVHQIDAIADHVIHSPFSHPQRLLVEAKCYATYHPIGIEVVRNAVGVLKDISEYWASREGLPGTSRYHYQYALFSASRFTADAERYAYAHDIYLLPMAESAFIQPVIRAIRKVKGVTADLAELRLAIRHRIGWHWERESLPSLDEKASEAIDVFCQKTHKIGEAAIAMAQGRFPIFMVPAPDVHLSKLDDLYEDVRIHWDAKGWYLRHEGKDLFSFDLPPDLFKEYADQGVLSRARALDLKEKVLREIQVIVTADRYPRVITMLLDMDWLNQIRKGIHQRRGQLPE